jgi:EAL domain-containing protein (putative c-di-GMP-specific phosphodiesterase class I)
VPGNRQNLHAGDRSDAHGLGLTVVSEGVESKEPVAILLQRRCDELQGAHP